MLGDSKMSTLPAANTDAVEADLSNAKISSSRWVPASLLLAGIVALFARFRFDSFLAYYDDDLFYYLQIARNVVYHHQSTFDGTHLTNGYHPLWMLVSVALTMVASGKTIYIVVQLILLASFMCIYALSRAILSFYTENQLASQLAAAMIALQSLLLIRGAMEITLTIPLALGLCWYRLRPIFRWTSSKALGYGLLASLVVLSRLDSVIFVSALLLSECLNTRPLRLRDLLLRTGTLVAFALPIALYLIFNQFVFHTWMPVSGQAKQLRINHSLSVAPFYSWFLYFPGTLRLLIVYPAIATVLAASLALFLRGRERLCRDHLPVVASLLLFPFLHLLALSISSDWPLWSWYLYPLVLAMEGSLLVFFSREPSRELLNNRTLRRALSVAAGLGICAFAIVEAHRTQVSNRCYIYGKDVAGFAQTHSGVFAMGDASGTAAYLMNRPLIKLEGLVMDQAYLENIRRQRSLNKVLVDYGVRYYISPNPTLTDGCYHTIEPAQAGRDAPHMQGTFCMRPIAVFQNGPDILDIFDLRPH
jgi:hypothetical protein